MKKLISFILSLALALSALSLTVSAYTAEELAAEGIYAPEISNLGSASTTVNAGGKATITLRFFKDNVMEATDVSLALTDCDELTLSEGSENISGINYGNDYKFVFSVPTTYTHANQTVSFELSYSYVAVGGLTKTDTKKLSYSIQINESINASEITVENLQLAENEVLYGGDVTVSYEVFNNRSTIINELVMTVEDTAGKELARKYIRSVSGLSSSDYSLIVPELKKEGKNELFLVLSYKNASGTEKTEKYSFTVNVKEKEYSVSDVRIENAAIENDCAIIGEKSMLSFDIINVGGGKASEMSVELYDGATVLVTKFVGTIDAQSTNTVAMSVPAFDKIGEKALTLKASYKEDDGKKSAIDKSVVLSIREGAELKIENAVFEKDSVYAGEKSSLTFDLVNFGKGDAKELSVKITDGKTEVYSKFIGNVAAENSLPITLTVPSFEETGEKSLKITVYYSAGGEAVTSEKTVALNILESNKLAVRNLSYQKRVLAENDNTVSFNLINKSDEEFKACQAYIYNGDKLVGTSFVGAIAAQSQTPVSVSYNAAVPSNAELTLKTTYKNTADKLLSSSESFSVEIYKDEVKNASDGYLKIQSIKLPLAAVKNTQVTLPVYVTNPTDVEIIGAELTAYDENGKAIDSVYVSSIPAKTSAEYSFTISAEAAGSHSFTIELAYTNKSGEEIVDNNSTISVEFADTASETGGEILPADLKIQKIKNPTNIYTNVKTDATIVFVNAGKGAASNVEYYVTDENGNEITREYIGNIAAASSMESTYSVKFTEVANYPLTLNVEYYNDDGSLQTVTRSYEQNVIDYRASLTDIAGLEYVMSDNPATLEFTVLNNGTETLLNATAYLRGEDGTTWGQLYIGTIDPGSKKERQRIKNLFLSTPDGQTGEIPLTLVIEYENTDMQVFSFSSALSAHYEVMNYDDMGGWDDGGMVIPDDGVQYDENGNPIEASAEGQGLEWWIWALIIGGGVIVVVIVLVIVIRHAKKKKSEKDDDDDIEYLNMLTGSGSDKK